MTSAEARAQHAAAASARRNAEAACALDFLVYGDGSPAMFMGHTVVGVTHAERCVFGPAKACSRTYDPMPYAEAEPADTRLYEGTAIGALYGMPGPELAPLLEGWEIAPRSVHE